MEQGLRLRALYRSLGWKRSECAQFFHVSARTLHNWESGITAIPYAALKLLRIHARYELPGQEWNGWVFHSGKLWSPEGHGFSPGEASCWHNLCRRAHLFGVLLKENDQLRHKLRSEAVQRHQALQAPVAPLAQRAEGALLAREAPASAAAGALRGCGFLGIGYTFRHEYVHLDSATPWSGASFFRCSAKRIAHPFGSTGARGE